MRAAKSFGSLVGQQQQQQANPQGTQQIYARRQSNEPKNVQANHQTSGTPTSPICRCRVMYLGSSVPHITKDGLQGIQEPLRDLYPDRASLVAGNAGIDSWLSVWSNGILIENVDDNGREVKRFFKIEALHYCAAVKYVHQIGNQSFSATNMSNGNPAALPKFLPLDSPHARMQQSNSCPPIFASILRRTTGVKVLECHAFICKREAAANALVRCCFHAYADTMYAKQIGADSESFRNDTNNNSQQSQQQTGNYSESRINGTPSIAARRSKSIAGLNDAGDIHRDYSPNDDSANGGEYANSIAERKSVNENYAIIGGDIDNNRNSTRANNLNLKRQHNLSKSMHQLNLNGDATGNYSHDQSSLYHNNSQSVVNQPFYNPQASRVPCYPPSNLIDHHANNSGTLRSIKSVAANSIATTLLRSKKHAKAMSMAQINQERITSFHQPQTNGSTIGGSFLMPPIPTMFLPNLPRHIINGSQTMKMPSRPIEPYIRPPINFEAMTPKEMKKLIKKSAKYGIDPSKFGDNGLPLLPLRPMPTVSCQMTLPPPPPQLMMSKSGTLNSHPFFPSDMSQGHDIPDMASVGLPLGSRGMMPELLDQPTPIRSILVKPNPEFLKSKAGKKWLKQQKEFKKLLPPHLDGLPIVYGPPPNESLEPVPMSSNSNLQAHPNFMPSPHSGLPIMDSPGYYNPHPFYGPSGRASTASTLLRYSPHAHDNGVESDTDYLQRGHLLHGGPMMSTQSIIQAQHRDYIQDDGNLIYSNNPIPGPYDKHYSYNNGQHRPLKRNHMVEQSVISLGDENDGDDEEGHLNGY